MRSSFPFPVPEEARGDAQRLAEALEARGFTVSHYSRQLRRVVLGEEPLPGEWLRSGIEPGLFEASAQWLRASLEPRELFIADAVKAGATFDGLVARGAMTPAQLAGFLEQVFVAIMQRHPLPELGEPALVAALQWVCDLYVDAYNTDPVTPGHVAEQLRLLASGQRETGQLCAFLAQRVPLPRR